jgi:hypothetical protein
MMPIKQRLLEVIERTPDPLLEKALTFLETLIIQNQSALQPDDEFDPATDSKAQILADLRTSLEQSQAGQTFPIAELWVDRDG